MTQLEQTQKLINQLQDEGAGAGSLIAHQCELTAMLIDRLDELTVVGMTRKKKPTGKNPVTIDTYLAKCKEEEVQAIPADDAVFKYAADAGIPRSFIELCFKEFVERNQENKKRQKSWPQTFRNCVRQGWYKLWFHDGVEYKLTSAGIQAQKKHAS